MNQLGQRSRFLQRREILPLQILDGGNPQRVVLGEVVAYLDRDREILGQFAALLQQRNASKRRDPLTIWNRSFLPLPSTGLTTRLCRTPSVLMLAARPSMALRSIFRRGFAAAGCNADSDTDCNMV